MGHVRILLAVLRFGRDTIVECRLEDAGKEQMSLPTGVEYREKNDGMQCRLE
jgi:hypothetical protein